MPTFLLALIFFGVKFTLIKIVFDLVHLEDINNPYFKLSCCSDCKPELCSFVSYKKSLTLWL